MRGLITLSLLLSMSGISSAQSEFLRFGRNHFQRIATFPVVLNTCNGQPATCQDTQTVSEIVAASEDGKLLLYTDSAAEKLGFIDIATPAQPKPAGTVDMGGEPTSVAVAGHYALVAVNTSASQANPSGHLTVVDIGTQFVLRTIDLGGQPDSVAVSHNRRYAAIAIENERNEDLCVGGTWNGQEVDEDVCTGGGGVLGGLPQAPAGFLVIVDLVGAPSNWSTRTVSLTGYATLYPDDPEPEYVDISVSNVAAVTLQENNHIILIRLSTGEVTNHFSAGQATILQVDSEENESIELTGTVANRLREPDGVAWISPLQLAIANEGDLNGGTRGITIFSSFGALQFDSGNSLEHEVVALGHYPEARSEDKGNEPENIKYGRFRGQEFLFVASERSSVIFVYALGPFGDPELFQVLPSGVAPEGLAVIERHNLLISASEEDERGDGIRSALTIYQLTNDAPTYPTIRSANRADGLPIPWGALSALAADPIEPRRAYTVHDSFYVQSRIYELDLSDSPARITREIVLRDASGNGFDLDLEGLTLRADGGFWAVSEGGGNCSAVGVCAGVTSKNLLVAVAANGLVTQIVELPQAVNDRQRSNGYEGVARTGSGANEYVYVEFQREWIGDPVQNVRIGRYHVASGEWTFFYYPLDAVESPNGGNVGLSELVALDDNRFLVLERDNQAGIDARVKRIYQINISGLAPQPEGGVFPLANKTLVRDLLPDLRKPNGLVIEKVEGLDILANGEALIVTDNDGVDGSNGETQLIRLGQLTP